MSTGGQAQITLSKPIMAEATMHSKSMTPQDGASISHTHSFVSATLNSDQTGALALHNNARKAKSLNALTWDNTLQSQAQAWANHLASISQMEHSTSAQRPNEGENLATAWASNGIVNPMTQGTKSWLDESKYYTGQAIGSDFHAFGHYTQCMWHSTTKVGIATAKNAKGAWYTVARYSPPGNWVGQKPY